MRGGASAIALSEGEMVSGALVVRSGGVLPSALLW